MDFAAKFAAAFDYEAFLDKYASESDRQRWDAVWQRLSLSGPQQALLAGFERDMKVLVMAGAWCGDCVNQCPMFARFAAASPRVQLRLIDRDADEELRDGLTVCGGARVPAVVFLSEDDQFVAQYGDRTLSKYRQMAAQQLGERCPPGIAAAADPASTEAAVLQEWLDEFLRAQLILRLSPRLRQRHGD